jgi:hypothetical protein
LSFVLKEKKSLYLSDSIRTRNPQKKAMTHSEEHKGQKKEKKKKKEN